MELETKRIEWTKTFEEYLENMTDEDGVQESNIDEEEREGIKTLKKRVADSEIMTS